MKIEDCIVSVERRTAGGCLDLAIVFTQHFAGPIVRLLVTFALPCCLLTWWLTNDSTDMLLIAVPIFSIFASLMSAALIATVGPQVFGVPLSTRNGLTAIRHRFFAFVFLTSVVRMAQLVLGCCLILPLVFPTAMLGHLNEVLFLERTPFKEVTRRLSTLGKGGGFSRNLSRVVGLLGFWALCSVGLFIFGNQLAGWIFNVPIFEAPLVGGEDWGKALAASLVDDQAVVLLMQISVWIPFPIVRLAWFFCYLDQRIRNECWDLDLQFRAEATRLEELTA